MSANHSSDYFLDPKRVRRAFDRASVTFDRAAAVHGEIRQRLIERLDVIRMNPAVVLDLGAGSGQGTSELKRRFSSAAVIAMDLSARMLALAGKRSRLFRRFDCVAGDAQQLPLRDGSVDLIFSNLMLQWVAYPDAALVEARRVLRPEGLLTFTSLGPDSLRELRTVWEEAGAHPHVHAFIDMHDLGDALMRAGFVEPVMDTERLTVTYRDWSTLLGELRDTGSVNIAQGRYRGLTTRGALQRVIHRLDAMRRQGVLPVTLEIVYGHAWAGAPKKRGGDKEVRVPISSLRRPR
jgi:malonyl-CoA O-methyltransferase